MMNVTYYEMNAASIAAKIIEKEEAYLNASIQRMPFEGQCIYALELTPILHPAVSPDPIRRAQLLENLRPDLLRRAQYEDAFALYVLGNTYADLSAPATDVERRFLERSMQAGYVPAAMALLDRFYHGKKRAEPEAERIASWLAEQMSDGADAVQEFHYYSLMGDKERARELAIGLALHGDYLAASYLANHSGDVLDFDSDERVFWETVEFLVLDCFYSRGAKHLGDTLGMKLINGRGCERDLERIKEIYVDLMLRYPYNRRQLLTLAGVPHDDDSEDLAEAERVCRLLINDGKESNYWRLILIALLSGKRDALERACDEAGRARGGLLCANVAKAYHILKQVERSA